MYLLTTGGQPFISDGEVMFLTAVRIVDAQTLALPEWATIFPQVVRGYDGLCYSRYGLGQPLLGALFYWIGRYVVAWYVLPVANDFFVGRFVTLLLPACATALTGALVCAWAKQLYCSVRVAVALALLYGLGTMAWPYSRFFFSEPLFTLCLFLAAFAIYQQRPLIAGVACGYALATRLDGLVLLPALFTYAWLRGYRLSMVGKVLFGLLPGCIMVLLHNWVRFHTLTEQGYSGEGFTGNLVVGLYGLLLSSGKSVFLYVPVLLAFPFAVGAFYRHFRAEAVLVGLVVLITLLKSAWWWSWWGGWCWGPRFLLPLMPFLILAMGVLYNHGFWRYVMGFLLLPLSLATNLLGIVVDFNAYLRDVTRGDTMREYIYLFQPAYSPIVAHLKRLDVANVPIVSFRLSQHDIGFAPTIAPFLSFGIVVLLVVSFLGVYRSIRWNADVGVYGGKSSNDYA